MTEHSEVRDGVAIDWDVPIEMDDGLVLRADIFRPVEDEPAPVILTYGPYAKGLAFQEGYPSAWERMVTLHPDVAAGSTNVYQNWEVVDPEKWVPEGYVCVRVDSRGCGRSPGFINHFSERETQDFAACIEWAGVQPWSTGKVGLNGISYYAMNQWQVASLQPEHLTAMCAWEGAADFYRDSSHHGGLLSTFWDNWYDMQIKTVQYGMGKRGPVHPVTDVPACGDETLSEEELERNRCDFGDDIAAHQLDDDYHRVRSPDWDRVSVPFLSAGNWGGQGLHLRGNVEAFVRAASQQKWLELHGGEHWTEFYTDYGVNLQKRFFAHFLKGEDNGWDQQQPVMLNVRAVDGFHRRDETDWPLPGTVWKRFYLDGNAQVLGGQPVQDTGTCSYGAMGDGVTFSMPALDETTEVTGPVSARLFVSSSTQDADLFLVLRVFDPDNKEVVFQGAIDPRTPIAQGWLRASQRKLDESLTAPYRPYHTHDEVELLEPGEIYQLDIELWPTSLVIPPGYRIALTVRGRDYEHPDAGGDRLSNFKNELRGSGPFLHDDPRNRPQEIFDNAVTLHCGGIHDSSLLLPVIPEERPTTRSIT